MKAEHEKASTRPSSRPAGRPADARHRRQGRGLQRRPLRRSSRTTRNRSSTTPASWRVCSVKSAACASFPAVPKATSSWSTCAPRTSPARMPRLPRPCPHHGQQERHPERSAEAVRHLRYPHRLAGHDDAWFHRDRSRADRPPDRRRARRARTTRAVAATVRQRLPRCAADVPGLRRVIGCEMPFLRRGNTAVRRHPSERRVTSSVAAGSAMPATSVSRPTSGQKSSCRRWSRRMACVPSSSAKSCVPA